jgi:hypothetical protein
MAGAGYKTFLDGEVLEAVEVNTYLMDQVIMVFPSSAARDSALGGNVAEGMFSYLTDTNSFQFYDGAGWQAAGGGDGGGLTGALLLGGM